MMPEIPDKPQRERALDPSKSFIVRSPAGSGKTELLAQRFLRLLALVEQPESIVAITFTRKAAAEMRGRILDALHAAEGPCPDSGHKALTWELARRALENDLSHRWRIRENPSRLRITTIDSFCLMLARRMPWMARFGAPPDIEEAPGELYREAARATLAQLESGEGWSDAVARLLDHLDNNLPAVEDLLVNMLSRREQWLGHVVTQTSRVELERALRLAVEQDLARVKATLRADVAAILIPCAAEAASNLRASDPSNRIAACVAMSSVPAATAENLPLWQGLADLLLTKNGRFRKRVDRNTGFPPGSPLKSDVAVLLESLQSRQDLAEMWGEVRHLPEPRYTDEQWSVLEALFQLLRLAAGSLMIAFREHRKVDFTAVAMAAIEALGSLDTPTDLAYSLDFRTEHILVDEFQDTSQLQFTLLRRLIDAWGADEPRSLFLVGDPMQSIYRFRQAEVGLFAGLFEKKLELASLEPLTLTVNFRSQANIVDWVNSTFPLILPEEPDFDRGAVSYSRSDAALSALGGPAVEVYPFAGADPHAEAEQVLRIVQQTQADDPEGKTAILVRNRDHASATALTLRRAGLRFLAVDMNPLFSRPVVQDLWSLTRALLHPADRIAWLAILRAPWCGMTLTDLLALTADDGATSLWDLMQASQRLEALSVEGRARLERTRAALETAIGRRGRAPLRSWIEAAWLDLGGPACLREPADEEDAGAFFQLLEENDQGGDIPDFADFERQLAALYAEPDPTAGDKLQILTMHKAKGLEFDTVIIPGLGRGPGRDGPRLLNWLVLPGRSEGALLLAPIKRSGTEHEPIAEYLQSFERRKQDYETGRLLYVAATRAKKRLHLLGHVSEKGNPRSGSLLDKLWHAVAQRFADLPPPKKQGDESLDAERPPAVFRRLPLAWLRPDIPPGIACTGVQAIAGEQPAVAFEWVGDTLRHVGTLVHRIIEEIGREGLDAWNSGRIRRSRQRWETALTALGVPPAELPAAAMRVERALEAILADERGRWILTPRDSSRSEFPLTGVVAGGLVSGIVDRTFLDEAGVRWIIDFKTSMHEGGSVDVFLDNEQSRYRSQLERYAELFSHMEDAPIRLGLYFPLLSGWREWSWGGRGVSTASFQSG
jgi:ATP-dependent exoDNAse (exonuclease V) beta subunit